MFRFLGEKITFPVITDFIPSVGIVQVKQLWVLSKTCDRNIVLFPRAWPRMNYLYKLKSAYTWYTCLKKECNGLEILKCWRKEDCLKGPWNGYRLNERESREHRELC